MKISDPNSNFRPADQSRSVAPPDSVSSNENNRLRGPAGQSFATDHAQLSNLSAQLAGNTGVHLEKLSQLAAAVSSGAYRPDARAVSHSIIEDGFARAYL